MNNKKLAMPAKIISAFILSAVLIFISGMIYYFLEKSISETDVKNQITAIAKIKSDEISNWRKERIGDAKVLSRNSEFISVCNDYLKNINPDKNLISLKSRIEALALYNQYDNMILVDKSDVVKYVFKEGFKDYETKALKKFNDTSASKEISFSDFYLSDNDEIHLDVIAPLFFENNYIGSLVLSVNPENVLYPMLQNFPYETSSGENLLIKVDNGEVIYLNEIRFVKKSALKFKIPVTNDNSDILAVKAAKGQIGLTDGIDYLKNNVTGYITRISNSDWILITKINKDEIYSSVRKKSYYTLSLLLFIILAVSLSFYFFWNERKKQNSYILNQIELQTQYNRSLIESSIDPLVTIDPEGKITDVNLATIRVTGLSRDLLVGTEFHNYFTEPDKAKEGYLKVFNDGFVKDYPLTVRNLSGSLTPVLYNASTYKDENGKVIGVFAAARDITELEKVRELSEQQDWIKSGLASLNDVMRGNLNVYNFGSNVIQAVSHYLNAEIGVFYANTDNNNKEDYCIIGSYAFPDSDVKNKSIKLGEGLIGQTAIDKKQIIIKNIPDSYFRIKSGLGNTLPNTLCITPVLKDGDVMGIIEVAMLNEISEIGKQYLTEASRLIALSLSAVIVSEELKSQFKRAQDLAEELQRQQEELKASNEELEEQTMLLKQSEEKLKAQQEELQVSNEELEARNDALELQKREIEQARNDLNIKAEELELASKYKSEFLANMSHELRTPLNSLLILSKMLHENREGNLTKEQIESSEIIYNSGNDLLHLINEILDLAKIEAGRMDIHSENVYVTELVDSVKSNFKHMAEEKGLQLKLSVSKDSPELIISDRKRIEQILKNLISNAIKFTKKGEVKLTFNKPLKDSIFQNPELRVDNCISIEVADTGIGISKENQKLIFQAFHQEEGGISREFGGTGLGLSISKELANLLGGEISLSSEKGVGSKFTLYLPLEIILQNKPSENYEKEKYEPTVEKYSKDNISKDELGDDRKSVLPGEKVILIIEDNLNFAKLLHKECNSKGFKGLIALNGEDGLNLAGKFKPSGIILDIKLPGMDGYQVLEVLKESSKLRHIPVHIMSADDSNIEAFKKGAIGFLTKPPQKEQLDEAFNKLIDYSNRNMKNLIIAEDDKNLRESIVRLIGNGDVKTTAVSSGEEVINELGKKNYDCMIMDLGLSDISGFELLKTLEKMKINIPPVIVYTGKDITRSEEEELRNYAESIIIKGVSSQERLLDEASLFLHRVVENLPLQKRKMIINLHETDEMFSDKKLLLVDDDMRNMFALSKILAQKGFKLLKAENGIKALEVLKTNSDVDLILMDIMMPEMDGYETMRRIRAQEKFFNIPIIALTAKAMKKDYANCIEAGASDYLPKPINIDRLCSMLRVWLYR